MKKIRTFFEIRDFMTPGTPKTQIWNPVWLWSVGLSVCHKTVGLYRSSNPNKIWHLLEIGKDKQLLSKTSFFCKMYGLAKIGWTIKNFWTLFLSLASLFLWSWYTKMAVIKLTRFQRKHRLLRSAKYWFKTNKTYKISW